jgi:hypothetical protein
MKSWLRNGRFVLIARARNFLPGTDASMAPGFETAEALRRSKADVNYWAKPAPAEAAE